jgi:alanyl-tRNA synthetase
MSAKQLIDSYLSFFNARGHVRIPSSPLVPDNDPTTLFTSSGMQPLIPYLLGEPHPSGTRLVNVQNCFRAQDIDEIGDNRHTTFFRMLGNWSLGDYFKDDQLPWIYTFLTDPKEGLGIDPSRLHVTVFNGDTTLAADKYSKDIWLTLLSAKGINPDTHLHEYGVKKNWWSRSGVPDNMPPGEPGGPDSEVFYDFGEALGIHENSEWKDDPCHPNCDCGRFMEIANSVFMEYLMTADGFVSLPKKNVDFGGGLERMLAAVENQYDVFRTSLFYPIITCAEETIGIPYATHARELRIITDHLISSMHMISQHILPSNKEQGYVLRRLLRRSADMLLVHACENIEPILRTIAAQYSQTDPILTEEFDRISATIIQELSQYKKTLASARKLIEKELVKQGLRSGNGPIKQTTLPADTAFRAITSFGLSPAQLENLGYIFNRAALAEKIQAHKDLSRTQSAGKFKGGLADHSELTVKGHTATHLLQQALRDIVGTHVFQSGSNITPERVRFDFTHTQLLTQEQIDEVNRIVNEKINADLPVHFEMLDGAEAKKTGAIGLFDEKYQEKVKVYFIGGSGKEGDHDAYSKEFCGGPHVPHTGVIQSFTITKQEKLGNKHIRVYAVVQ